MCVGGRVVHSNIIWRWEAMRRVGMEITYATSSSVDISTTAAVATDISMPNRGVKIIPLQHPSSSSAPGPSSSFPFIAKWRSSFNRMSWAEWLELIFPCFRWIRTYKWREYLQPDLMAGITVGVMLVPQSMSYAKLAGLQPIYGLYSGFVPIFVYAIFGSSRQLAIGPVALVSLLVSNVLGGIVDSDDELYTELAILLALMVGILECVMGLLRLGWLIRFISHSVISGFTTSSAIVIGLSQAKYFLGYEVTRSSEIIPLIKSIIAGADGFLWPPFVMGFVTLALLLVMKHLGKSKKLRFLRAAGPLTAVVLGTTFVKIFHPSSISLVGDIPQGLPKFSIPMHFGHAKSLISTTILITGVAILESVGIAKALAAKNGYELDSNQELFGLGVANICGSFFSSYPTTGSFSRSAVNYESGAKTGLSGIIMGIIMGCALLFLTPLFTEIPELVGYGFAGLFVKFLVNPPRMWWPQELVDVTFFRTLNEKDESTPKGQLTRLQFFIIVFVCSFAYYIVPNYFFPSITALSFVCWIWKDSVTAQQIGSGRKGLGIGSIALDWTTISGFLGSPLALPTFAVVNTMAGFILLLYVICPIAYWTNSYDAKRFPIFSSAVFDHDGQPYNVSRILNQKYFQFDQEGYRNYSKMHLSSVYAFSYGFSFAAATASVAHVALFYGRSFWQQVKSAYQDNTDDIHNRLMKKYDRIPQWWFFIVSVAMVGLAIGFGKQLQLPALGVILACVVSLLFILPTAVLVATTGQDPMISMIYNVIIGYLYPGRPLANMAFVVYCDISSGHAISTLASLKLGHYMKIPPKSVFIVLIVGIVVSSTTNFCVSWWILSTVENLCDRAELPKGSPWTCPGYDVFYDQSFVWGVVGPGHMFAPHGQYRNIYVFFGIGALAPVLVWMLVYIFPTKKWIQLINVPLILSVGAMMPPATAVNYWGWFIVGLLFNHIVYKKFKGWWIKYNYVLSSALDAGVAFMALLAYFALQLNNIYGVNWWGLELDDHCPLAHCPTASGIVVEGCPVFS